MKRLIESIVILLGMLIMLGIDSILDFLLFP